MQRNYALVEETIGYVTNEDETNTNSRFLVSGSQNTLIDRNRKTGSRGGYTRLGASNTALTPNRGGTTWNTSTGTELPIRQYDDELEVYLGTVDGTAINGWRRVTSSLSTTELARFATWWDTGENLDLLLFILGDANMYEWGGGVAVVSSITGTTVTKAGTTTFAQNRFYTSRNLTFINLTNGTEYTYTGGAGTTTLTGIADTAGIATGDILVQKIVTQSNKPAASHTNDTIYSFENQICIGSFDDNEIHISQNDDYDDFSLSAPRIAGEGSLLTLDGPSRGISSVGKILVPFAGEDSIFRCNYEEITVGSTLTETLRVKKLQTATKQGSKGPNSIIQTGKEIIYLSNEPALRSIQDPDQVEGFNPKTLSNPIKPDFDAEDFTNAYALWHKNSVYLTAPNNSMVYILEFVEDADGKLRRFWQPPQILPARILVPISGNLHAHSNAVPETYRLFNGNSDTASDDSKLPIRAIAAYSYNSFEKRGLLKNSDEYYVEGEISPSTTDLMVTLNFDFGGQTAQVTRVIDGTDEDITSGTIVGASLGESTLALNPLGGLLNPPDDTKKFQVALEHAREDYHKIQVIFETNEVDRYFAIIAHGPNSVVSRRRNTVIKQ